MEEEIKSLTKQVNSLLNIVQSYRFELDKLNHLARDINLIKLSGVLEGVKSDKS